MAELKDPATQAKVNFLQIESKVGLNFACIARDTSNREKRKRLINDARKAYDTACRLKKRVQMNEEEKVRLSQNLLQLKEELQQLGEKF